ncbi:hypothetical protein M422DRAFT_187532, partial [Sphaerobolus stellatus SS14]
WFLSDDNLNIPFQVFEQRPENQSHFDSGTAGPVSLQAQRIIGSRIELKAEEITGLDAVASQFIYQVWYFPLDAPPFDFATYKYNQSSSFQEPEPVKLLPSGKANATQQYMLKTVHIEEASYEGNDCVLAEFQSQIGLGSLEEKKRTGKERVIVWIGDQLTNSHLLGLQNFRAEDHTSYGHLNFLAPGLGWLHLMMLFASSLHSQYDLTGN